MPYFVNSCSLYCVSCQLLENVTTNYILNCRYLKRIMEDGCAL